MPAIVGAMLFGAAIGFVAGSIDAAMHGARGADALRAGAINAGIGAVAAAGLHVVGAGINAIAIPEVSTAFNVALTASSAYGAVQSFRSGSIASATVSLVGFAFGVAGIASSSQATTGGGSNKDLLKGKRNYPFILKQAQKRFDLASINFDSWEEFILELGINGIGQAKMDIERFGSSDVAGLLTAFELNGGTFKLSSVYLEGCGRAGCYRAGNAFYPEEIMITPDSFRSYDEFLDTVIHEVAHPIMSHEPDLPGSQLEIGNVRFAAIEFDQIARGRGR